jgi:hypothetical protein
MNGTKVFRITGMILFVGICMLGTMAPQAKADKLDERTFFTFSSPVEMPGTVLPAGTYMFKVVDTRDARDLVQVSDESGTKVYGTFQTVTDQRANPTAKTVITFDERSSNSPEAVKEWFYPGNNFGHQFVYPKVEGHTAG